MEFSDRALAQLATPFVLFAMLLIAYPFKWAITKYMRDGKLKRFLLFRWGDPKPNTPNLDQKICNFVVKCFRRITR
jgi:hypothetical protein